MLGRAGPLAYREQGDEGRSEKGSPAEKTAANAWELFPRKREGTERLRDFIFEVEEV